MNIVDPILLGLLSLFALRGYFKGLFRESSSLLGLLIGLMIAVRYDEPAAALWSDYWKASLIVLRVAAFVGIFFAIYLAFGVAGWLLHRLAKPAPVQAANRLGGVLLGMGKGAAILAFVLFFLMWFPLIPQKTRQKIEESYLAPPLQYIAQGLIEVGKANIFPQEDSASRDGESAGYF